MQNRVLLKIENRVDEIILGYERDGIPFTFQNFSRDFLKKGESNKLFEYFETWINRFEEAGSISTASQYRTASNALKDLFKKNDKRGTEEITLAQIEYSTLLDFVHFCRVRKGLKDTSISVYLRALRALLNKAIKGKILKRDAYPFEEFRLSDHLKTKTPKRAISKKLIEKIEQLEFEDFSKEQFAQHIFLFTYYMRGINFVDIAKLTWENVIDGRLIYTRTKTQKPFNLKIHKKALPILEFYKNNNWKEGNYIFPVFDDKIHITPRKLQNQRKQVLRRVNTTLNDIAKLIGEENLNLTTYVGRHSYANVLRKSGQEIAVISEALGHSLEQTTKIYIKELENPALDNLDDELL